ncbi:MAG: ABC transporter ATP-binding protein [Halanaerobiales bacterium]
MEKKKILQVSDLETHFKTRRGMIKAVNGVDFDVHKGEILGLVGESGAGKSVTGFSLMRLVESPGEVVRGKVKFKNQDLLQLNEKEMRKIRGKEISMVFQDPMTSLNPVLTIGRQLQEVLTHHLNLNGSQARKRAIELLKMVGIPSPAERIDHYPSQLSGGMRQRVVIAIALASDPELIIADEPTTALDVTIQAQIMSLMKDLISRRDTALIIISHDLALISEIADRVAVMYAGQIVEKGSKSEVIAEPAHPYTRGLIASLPSLNKNQRRLQQIKGMMPSPLNLPSGCKFKPRCPNSTQRCETNPVLKKIEEDHFAACHHVSSSFVRDLKGVG